MTWLWFLGNKMIVDDLGAADDETAGTLEDDFSVWASVVVVDEDGGDVS